MKIHSKYYCGAQHDEKEWKLCGGLAFCKKCSRTQEPDSIEFHVGYLCQKRQIHVQCFYCSRIFDDYRGLLKHTNYAHHKKHRYQDLISILPSAESVFSIQGPVKVVKNCFSNYLNTPDETNSEMNSSANVSMLNTHVNTKCDSENHYNCFFCLFNAEYPYQVLNHMEVDHNKNFNTFDLIQAKLTGIVPIMETSSNELVPEDNEVEFANHQLFEPYLPQVQIFEKEDDFIKISEEKTLQKRNTSGKNTSTHYTQNPSENVSVCKKPKTGKSLNQNNSNQKSLVLKFKESGPNKKEFMRNVSLGLSTRRVKIGNNVVCGKKGKRKSITKLSCPKCQDLVIPGDMAIHMKYHCGTKVSNDWILRSGKALCLRCKKFQSSATIDFHVQYICKRKVFSVQCFYCPKIAKGYRSLLVHMRKGHNKVHYYQDLMTILPEAESVSRNPQNSLGSTGEQKVVKHLFIYESSTVSQNRDPTSSKFSSGEDFYTCLYCTYKSKAAFKVLGHMEETHTKSHNMYDLLKAKMAVSCFKE